MTQPNQVWSKAMTRTNPKRQPQFSQSAKPLFIVLSGPSGVGKDAVLTRIKESGYPLEYITTVTTRHRRASEKHGIDYRFISAEKFQVMIERRELLEWANVYGNLYGVPIQPVKEALDKKQDTIVKVDIQGAATIKKLLPQAVLIFLVPPSIEDLTLRLKQRHTESSFDLELRTKTAEEEMKQLPLFDYKVINRQGEIDQTISQIKAIIAAEKCRANPREVSL